MTKDFDNPRPPRAELPAHWSNEPKTPQPGTPKPAADFDRHRTQEDQTPRVKECGDFPGPRDSVSALIEQQERDASADQAKRIAAEIMAEHRGSPIGDAALRVLNDVMREMTEEINAIARGVQEGRIPQDVGRLALAWYLTPDAIETLVTVSGARGNWTTT